MQSQKIKAIFDKEGITEFEKDIRTMNNKELRKYFSFKTNRKINAARLVKNLIWQMYTWIRDGKMEPLEGNIRSFWYCSPKPVLSRLGFNVAGPKYPSLVYDCFVELVSVYHLFRYIDFGFIDERVYHRRIGAGNTGHLILVVEKDGLAGIVKELSVAYGITAIALGGFPSYLTTEYLLRNMAQEGMLVAPVHVFSAVDYDPGGYWIGQEFVAQLRCYEVEIGDTHSLIGPNNYPPELLDAAKYRLPGGTKTDNWMQLTGGISGEPFGLELDALGSRRIREAFIAAIKPYLLSAGDIPEDRDQGLDRYWRALPAPAVYA